MTEVAPGQIRGRGLGRRFLIRLSHSRSLKEAILRRELPKTREIWALRDVDLDVDSGEAFGIVGRNGSGKSTLLKLLAHIYAPSTGRLAVGGRVGSLIEIGAGFHPDFTGVENVYLNASIYGLKRSYVDAHLDEIIDFAELEAFKDAPVRTYSSGMYMRLGSRLSPRRGLEEAASPSASAIRPATISARRRRTGCSCALDSSSGCGCTSRDCRCARAASSSRSPCATATGRRSSPLPTLRS